MRDTLLLQLLIVLDIDPMDPNARFKRLFKFGVEKKVYVNKTLLIFKRHRDIKLGETGPNTHLPIVVVYVVIGKDNKIDFEYSYTSDSVYIIPKAMDDYSVSTNIMLSTPVFSEVTIEEAMDDIWNAYNRYNGIIPRLFNLFKDKTELAPNRSWRYLNNGNIANGLPELLESLSLNTMDIFRASRESWIIKKKIIDNEYDVYVLQINPLYIIVDRLGSIHKFNCKLEYEYSLDHELHTDWIMWNPELLETANNGVHFKDGESMLEVLKVGLDIDTDKLKILAKAFNKLED